MKKFMIATHGNCAQGLKDSARIIAGDYYADQIKTVCAFVDDSDFSIDIQRFVDDLEADDQGIIFTDLYCGSVNQKATLIKGQCDKQLFVVSGVNLGLLMEIILNGEETINEEIINSAIELAKNEITLSPKPEANSEDNNDDFFTE